MKQIQLGHCITCKEPLWASISKEMFVGAAGENLSVIKVEGTCEDGHTHSYFVWRDEVFPN